MDEKLNGRYRKKPVVIEAFQWTADHDQADNPVWIVEALKDGLAEIKRPAIIAGGVDLHMVIHTLEGVMRANVGDWIIRGVQGEIYPCKPEIFAATYEPESLSPPPSDDNHWRCVACKRVVQSEVAPICCPCGDCRGRTFAKVDRTSPPPSYEGVAQRLQDHMEQFHGVCLSASDWDAAVLNSFIGSEG